MENSNIPPTYDFGDSETRTRDNNRWWEIPAAPSDGDDGRDLSRCAFDVFNALRDEQAYLHRRYKKCIEQYENIRIDNLLAWQYSSPVDKDGPNQLNITEQMIDTLQAEIISNRTKPMFTTSGGDFLAQEQAEELTRFCVGLFSDCKVHEKLAPAVCTDALVFGTGIAKVWEEGGKIRAQRIFPAEVVVDTVQASLAEPRTLYHHRILGRDSVIAAFVCDYDEGQDGSDGEDGDSDMRKKAREENRRVRRILENATDYSGQKLSVSGSASRGIRDLVQVIEAWRLPTGTEPGRHIVAVEGSGCLLDEEWGHDWFPFVMLRYKPRTKGFWGKGVAEILEGHQAIINSFREKIIAQLALSSPILWTAPGSDTNADSMRSNGLFTIIQTPEPPKLIVSPSVPGDLMQRLREEISDAGSMIGINTFMMDSTIPKGIDGGSGVALRLYNDTKSKRFMNFARAFDTFHIDLCELMVKTADACEDAGNSEIIANFYDEIQVRRIKYADIRLPEEAYVIRPAPVNFLSESPSFRMSDVETLMPYLPDDQKMPFLAKAMRQPDMQDFTSNVSADEDAIDKAISLILRGIKTSAEVSPSAYMKPELAIERARVAYLKAKTDGAPDERLNELENWMDLCMNLKSLIENAQAPAQPEMQAPDPSMDPTQPQPPMGMPEQMPMAPMAPMVG